MPENLITTVEQLQTAYPELVSQVALSAKDTGAVEAETSERNRVKAIVEFGLSVPCDVSTEMLNAIDTGQGCHEAHNVFLKVEMQHRDEEAQKPTGLKGDSQVEGQERFSDYAAAWQTIKTEENCSTVEAMRRAQDRYPSLYKEFLDKAPRGKV